MQGPQNNYTTLLHNIDFHFSYWGVLLMPKYYLNKKHNNSWYCGAGISIGIYPHMTATTDYSLYGNNIYQVSTDIPFELVSIGKNFIISRNIYFSLESKIQASSYSEKISKNTSVELTTFSYAGQTGVNY